MPIFLRIVRQTVKNHPINPILGMIALQPGIRDGRHWVHRFFTSREQRVPFPGWLLVVPFNFVKATPRRVVSGHGQQDQSPHGGLGWQVP